MALSSVSEFSANGCMLESGSRNHVLGLHPPVCILAPVCLCAPPASEQDVLPHVGVPQHRPEGAAGGE
eukprot:357293-Pyramimonas_sp.AAC.1